MLGYLVWLAAEPHLRRLWPELLISWSRLLRGRFRDPMVGRDLLVGAGFGVLIWSLTIGASWADDSIRYSRAFDIEYGQSLVGLRSALAALVFSFFLNLLFPLLVATVLLILRILLRRRWLAGLAWVAFLSLDFGLTDPQPLARFLAVATAALLLLVLVRFGFLALCSSTLFASTSFTPTLDASRWYFSHSALILSILAGIVAYGFYTSLGGRSVFSERFLDVQSPSST